MLLDTVCQCFRSGPLLLMLTLGAVTTALLVFHFYIEMKELCEARVKPEMSSNLADKPSFTDILPLFETASERSELIVDLCCQ